MKNWIMLIIEDCRPIKGCGKLCIESHLTLDAIRVQLLYRILLHRIRIEKAGKSTSVVRVFHFILDNIKERSK
jgi:hypothetical protein